ncbi:hypothetical protein [Hyunsoonleella rubra]|uniref:Uncharacterized protein n=1 Tax=Hyunsoonleella rubra TaxID=1737062 RepID=A0ABW5TF31_9FLAO
MAEDYILFNKLFNDFQKKSRTVNNYYDFEAFSDMKIILSKYVELYDKRAYNYYNLDVSKVRKMLSGFNNHMKKDLLSFFIKKLVLNGNTEKAREIIKFSNQVEINCSLADLKNGKNRIKNILNIIHKSSAYNYWTLIISLVLTIFFSLLIFSTAPYQFMEVIEVKKQLITTNKFLNNLCNLVLYIFDNDYKMEVKPISFCGVVLIISLKILFVLIIGNYLVRELLDKFKIS